MRHCSHHRERIPGRQQKTQRCRLSGRFSGCHHQSGKRQDLLQRLKITYETKAQGFSQKERSCAFFMDFSPFCTPAKDIRKFCIFCYIIVCLYFPFMKECQFFPFFSTHLPYNIIYKKMHETYGYFFHFFFHLPIEKPSAFCYDGSARAPLIVTTKRHWGQVYFLCFFNGFM